MKLPHINSSFFIALVLLFVATKGATAGDNCGGFGGMAELVCSTSHIQIVANPKVHEGKMVDFLSVVHRNSEKEIYLYPFNESREVGVIADVIRLDESGLDALNKHGVKSGDWIRVVGRFKTNDNVEFQQYSGVVSEVFLLVPVGQYRHLFKGEGKKPEATEKLD